MKPFEKRRDVARLIEIAEGLGLKPLTPDLIHVVDGAAPVLSLYAIRRLSQTVTRPESFMRGYRAYDAMPREHPYLTRAGGYAAAWERGYDAAAAIAEAAKP